MRQKSNLDECQPVGYSKVLADERFLASPRRTGQHGSVDDWGQPRKRAEQIRRIGVLNAVANDLSYH